MKPSLPEEVDIELILKKKEAVSLSSLHLEDAEEKLRPAQEMVEGTKSREVLVGRGGEKGKLISPIPSRSTSTLQERWITRHFFILPSLLILLFSFSFFSTRVLV